MTATGGADEDITPRRRITSAGHVSRAVGPPGRARDDQTVEKLKIPHRYGVAALRDECRNLQIPANGIKADVVRRLAAHMVEVNRVRPQGAHWRL